MYFFEQISNLDIEDKSDEIIVMDGGLTEETSVELRRFSGQLLDSQLYSSNNMMLVKFKSDGAGRKAGFTITVNQGKGVMFYGLIISSFNQNLMSTVENFSLLFWIL